MSAKRPTMPRPALASASFAQLTPTPGICMACGCTDNKACEGGCSWIDERQTLCSTCSDALIEAVSTWIHSRARR